MPSDETTLLLPRVSSFNWRRECYKHLSWGCLFWVVYSLLLVTDVGVFIDLSIRYFNVTDVPITDEELIVLTGTYTLNYCIFLAIVVTSPNFLGCCTVLWNLICLPRFWTLIFLFALYVIGNILEAIYSPELQKGLELDLAFSIMDVLHALTIVAVVCILNHVKVRNLVQGHSRFKKFLLKGALCVFFTYWFLSLLGAVFNVYFALFLIAPYDNNSQGVNSLTEPVITFLTLPFSTKITDLLWTKIFHDNKCIIGKYKSNSFNRQITLI